eukprot:12499107-Heterocapsa_arctica.AAC.1
MSTKQNNNKQTNKGNKTISIIPYISQASGSGTGEDGEEEERITEFTERPLTDEQPPEVEEVYDQYESSDISLHYNPPGVDSDPS